MESPLQLGRFFSGFWFLIFGCHFLIAH